MILVTACGAGSGEADATTPSIGPDPTTSTEPPPTAPTRPTVVSSADPDVPIGVFTSDEIVDTARRQAAVDTGLPPDDFEVERALQVTWNDGSLGCPQPGLFYTQALVDGYWVVLIHGDETYDYRSAMDAEFRVCADGGPPASAYVDR